MKRLRELKFLMEVFEKEVMRAGLWIENPSVEQVNHMFGRIIEDDEFTLPLVDNVRSKNMRLS